ncbi:unnamed protein product [Ranitomeya imitator]|uniref:Uncharacterized protein n=1 Tax=Ranitomeya imitator TaxID=111125 RepID=A0ABN9L5J7_9NEOB|nr:unnamed protein product [Ranitomeya imitator]
MNEAAAHLKLANADQGYDAHIAIYCVGCAIYYMGCAIYNDAGAFNNYLLLCGSVSSTDAQQRARTDYVTAPSNLSVIARGRCRRSRSEGADYGVGHNDGQKTRDSVELGAYGIVFIRKIKHRHTLAKNYFSQIPEIAPFLHQEKSDQMSAVNDLVISKPIAGNLQV